MNYAETVSEILERGGITRGITGAIPFYGYAYSLAGTEQRIPVEDFGPYDLAGYVQANYATLASPGAYLGAWIHDGDVVLDVSRVETDETYALILARANEQDAIYNLETGETVSTNERTA